MNNTLIFLGLGLFLPILAIIILELIPLLAEKKLEVPLAKQYKVYFIIFITITFLLLLFFSIDAIKEFFIYLRFDFINDFTITLQRFLNFIAESLSSFAEAILQLVSTLKEFQIYFIELLFFILAFSIKRILFYLYNICGFDYKKRLASAITWFSTLGVAIASSILNQWDWEMIAIFIGLWTIVGMIYLIYKPELETILDKEN